jgi:hypothetical protein
VLSLRGACLLIFHYIEFDPSFALVFLVEREREIQGMDHGFIYLFKFTTNEGISLG